MNYGLVLNLSCHFLKFGDAKNGSFLEKEFLSKEVSGRKVELDEVIEPSSRVGE
jgi:hypothetical protein